MFVVIVLLQSLDQLTNDAVPKKIQLQGLMNISEPMSKFKYYWLFKYK